MIRQSLLLALCLAVAAAFAPAPRCTRDSTVVLQATRREIIMGTAVVMGGLLSQSLPVLAEVDDLAMPSEDEQKAAEAAAMAEKLKRKAELQKKAAQPRNFNESLKSELQKKKDFGSQSKEERRAALCEELGRGC